MSLGAKLLGWINVIVVALIGIAAIVVVISTEDWGYGIILLGCILNLYVTREVWIPAVNSIRRTRASEERFWMRYIVKRCIPARGVIFKKGPIEESFGESDSLEIAGRLLASMPFYFDERCVIEDTRDGKIIGVKERRTI